MRSSRRFATALVVVAGLLAATLAAPATASAARHHRHHVTHHKRKTIHHKRAARTCPDLGRLSVGQHVWLDRHGANTNYMTRLVCSAADHSIINVKMWYIFDEPGSAHRFLSALALMHRYHHVQVNVHVGYDSYPQFRHKQGRAYLRHAEAASPGVHWFSCLHACTLFAPRAISHTKFITVSDLRHGGGPAVFTTSANVSKQQLSYTTQSGILFTRNLAMWRLFTHQFGIYKACALHRRCDRHLHRRGFTNVNGNGVYFAPTSIDPIADDLNRLDCSHGGEIDVTSLWLTRHTLVVALRAAKRNGCSVHIVIEHEELDTSVLREFGARVQRQHDKYLLVRTPKLHRTYEGSEDFGGKALWGNENVMVRTNSLSTFQTYRSEFRWQWRKSVPMSSPAAHHISMAARAVSGS